MSARSADEAEHRVVIHQPRRAAAEPRIEQASVRLIGPMQLEQHTGLGLPLCALVYSYLSDSERQAMQASNSPYGRDIKALRQYHPAPARGGLRVQGAGERGPLVAFAWQAREEIRASVTRGALAETLAQRDDLVGQARQVECGQRFGEWIYIDLAGLGSTAKLIGRGFDALQAGLTFSAALAARSPTLHAAGALTAARILGDAVLALTEKRRPALMHSCPAARHAPAPHAVKLCAAATHVIGAWLALALHRVAADKDEDSSSLNLLSVYAGFCAAMTLLELLIQTADAVVDPRRKAASDLYRRAEQASVLERREDAGRHALVYLDRNERIAVDVGAQPFVPAPFLSRFDTAEGSEELPFRSQ